MSFQHLSLQPSKRKMSWADIKGSVCKVRTKDPENFDEEVKSLVTAWRSTWINSYNLIAHNLSRHYFNSNKGLLLSFLFGRLRDRNSQTGLIASSGSFSYLEDF
jgi:hypothetical protein